MTLVIYNLINKCYKNICIKHCQSCVENKSSHFPGTNSIQTSTSMVIINVFWTSEIFTGCEANISIYNLTKLNLSNQLMSECT